MAKVRLHEASKKYGMSNKDLVELLINLGYRVKANPLVSLSDEISEALEEHFNNLSPKPSAKKVSSAKTLSKPKPKLDTSHEQVVETKPAITPEFKMDEQMENEKNKGQDKLEQDKLEKEKHEKKKHEKKKLATKVVRIEDEEEVEVNKQITIIKTTTSKKDALPAKKKKVGKVKDKRAAFSKKVQDELYEQERQTEALIEPETIKSTRKQEEEMPKISIPQDVTVSQLAKYLDTDALKIIKTLFSLGVVASLNQRLEAEQIQLLGNEFGKEVVFIDDVIDFEDVEDTEDELKLRPPVVTIMGHVDHGKTSLIDFIRKAHVVDSESGGITQHIGAYQVKTDNGLITFIDTPGHEAFTAMRAQGALVTDIIVLVVAADDGVQPQTVEAIHHSQAAGIPIVVAINKIDKPEANIDKVKQQLMPYNLVADDWGGQVTMVPISALTGKGVDDLLEMILLQAEMIELKANPDRSAIGSIIEARLDKGMGPLATVLIENGTICTGDNIICGSTYGRVKGMINDRGAKVKVAGPATPVAVLGLNEIPSVGDKLRVVESAKFARYVGQLRMKKAREERLSRDGRLKLADLFKQVTEGHVKELNIIIKADVQGSAGALRDSLERLSNDEVSVKVIHAGVGAITEADVHLANASNAIIIGFHVRPITAASDAAKKDDVEIKVFKIIYDAIDAVKKALIGLYDPEYEEESLGKAEVRKVYKVSGVGAICGSYVLNGTIHRNASARIIRDGIEVYEGKVSSLKRFKDDIKEVHAGYECGIGVDRFNDIKEGDILEAFRLKEIERTL